MRIKPQTVDALPKLLAVFLTVLVTASFACGVASLAAAADARRQAERAPDKVIVRTVDASGRVTYSDRTLDTGAPVAQRSVINARSGHPRADARAEPDGTTRPGSAARAAGDGVVEAHAANLAKLNAHNCEVSRKNLDTLNSGRRIVRFDDAGGMVPLSDAQLADERKRIEAEAREFCG